MITLPYSNGRGLFFFIPVCEKATPAQRSMTASKATYFFIRSSFERLSSLVTDITNLHKTAPLTSQMPQPVQSSHLHAAVARRPFSAGSFAIPHLGIPQL